MIPDEDKLDKETNVLRNILVLTVCIQLFAPVHSLAMRVNYYFLPFIPILITKIIKYSNKNLKIVSTVSIYFMCIGFIALFFYRAYFGEDILQVFPYISLWETVA